MSFIKAYEKETTVKDNTAAISLTKLYQNSHSRISSTATIIAVSLLLVVLDEVAECGTVPYCINGLQYVCRTRLGDGNKCVSGCNASITKLLSPGDCTDNCCKICYTDCHHCSYTKIVILCITNRVWTDLYLENNSILFSNLSLQLGTGIHKVLNMSNITNYSIELLRATKEKIAVKVFIKLVSRNQAMETLTLDLLRNATKRGQIGNLQVSNQTFQVISESEFYGTADRRGHVGLDMVEMIVTCAVLLIIMLAIGVCLFYFCTTPNQRKKCNPCRKNRVQN